MSGTATEISGAGEMKKTTRNLTLKETESAYGETAD